MEIASNKREKMLKTIREIKMNISDKETLDNLTLIENEMFKYGLVWEQHFEKFDKDIQSNILSFEELKNREIVYDDNHKYNFLIEGDNLQSLYLLEKTHKDKIDIIYIDPPYNTGKRNFVYTDNYEDNNDLYKHSKWLSFISRRLEIAKKLLKDSGVIFISIDDNELAQLKLLCDEIFAEENYVAILSIENNPKGRKNSNFISVSNEYCLIYAKNKSSIYFKENIPKNINDLTKDEKGKYVHNSGKRVLVGENKFNANVRNFNSDKHYSVYYNSDNNDMIVKKESIIEEIDKQLIDKGYERYYSYNEKGFVLNTYSTNKIIELFNKGALDFKNHKIYEKNFSTTTRLKSLVTNKEYTAVINNEEKHFCLDVKTTSANKELNNILGTNKVVFNNPKNVSLIKLLLTLIDNKNAIILDFFAGSATTGQAVLELNKEDGGNREFILCTDNENNICEDITYQRLKTVITGIRKDNSKYSSGIKTNLKYYRCISFEKTTDNLLESIKNLIQLENGINIDNHKTKLCFEKKEIEEIKTNEYEKIYISSNIVLSDEEKKKFEKTEICIIPNYYLDEEMTIKTIKR